MKTDTVRLNITLNKKLPRPNKDSTSKFNEMQEIVAYTTNFFIELKVQ